jgi:hypothetical protein
LASAKRLHGSGVPVDIATVKLDLEQRGELDAAGGGELPDLTIAGNRTDSGAASALVALHGHDLRYQGGQDARHQLPVFLFVGERYLEVVTDGQAEALQV